MAERAKAHHSAKSPDVIKAKLDARMEGADARKGEALAATAAKAQEEMAKAATAQEVKAKLEAEGDAKRGE